MSNSITQERQVSTTDIISTHPLRSMICITKIKRLTSMRGDGIMMKAARMIKMKRLGSMTIATRLILQTLRLIGMNTRSISQEMSPVAMISGSRRGTIKLGSMRGNLRRDTKNTATSMTRTSITRRKILSRCRTRAIYSINNASSSIN